MRLYNELLPQVVATFHLPDHIAHEQLVEVPPGFIQERIQRMPFPCIRIVGATVDDRDLGKVKFDVLCVRENDRYRWVNRIVHVATGQVLFVPEDVVTPNGSMATEYLRLLDYLERPRQFGLIEQPVNRQQRRGLGVASSYREYVIVRRNRRDPAILSLSQVIRRHPMLHAVRGHLRRLHSGQQTFVRPHTRGRGDLFQVKDYRVGDGSK